MARLATKKVEVEPGLVSRLAGGGSAPRSKYGPQLIYNFFVPVSIVQLVGTCIIICMGWGSNPGHPTYSP